MPAPAMSPEHFFASLADLPVGHKGAGKVLRELVRIAREQTSQTTVRLATGYAAGLLHAKNDVGWVLAQFGDPAVIVVREDLDDGERIWTIARLICALRNAPSNIPLGSFGIIASPPPPSDCWPAGNETQAALDDDAVALLLSMKVPEQAAWLFHRATC